MGELWKNATKKMGSLKFSEEDNEFVFKSS